MTEEIIIEIDEDGNLSADVTSGPGGVHCEKELDKLLGGLGKKMVNKRKPEYYKKAKVGKRVRNSG